MKIIIKNFHYLRVCTLLFFIPFFTVPASAQGSQGPCEDCLTFNSFFFVYNNQVIVTYKTEVDVIFGQNRTHFTEFYVNGVLKSTEGFENVGFGASKEYSYGINLEEYAGMKLEVEVKEYKTNDNKTNGEKLRETSRVIFEKTPLQYADLDRLISVTNLDGSPNSCGEQRFTTFNGIPSEAQIKQVTQQSSNLFVAPKGESAVFIVTYFTGLYDKVTWSFRNRAGEGTELNPEEVDWLPAIVPSKSVLVGFNSLDVSFNSEYNSSYPMVVKFYKSGAVVNTIVIPLLVVGQRTDLTNAKTTMSAPIPSMILHNPVGDGSESFMATTAKTCSQVTTAMDNSQNNNAYLDVQVGVEGSVVGIPFEAYGSARTDVTTEQGNSKQMVSETCLSSAENMKIFNSEDDETEYEGTDGDLFIGMSTRYRYGPSITVSHTNCGVSVTNGIGIQVEKTFPFAKRQIDIEREIESIEQTLQNPNSGLSDKDRRFLENDLSAWQQMVAKNKAYVENSTNVIRQYDVQKGVSQDFSLEISRSESFTLETKLFVENSVSGTVGVKVAGTGFEAGGGVKISNTVSNGNTTSSDYSNITGFSLLENESGDLVKINIKEDKRFGSYIFELVEEGSKTSCPYIGGARRDVPALSVGPEHSDYLDIPDAPIGDGENDRALVSMQVCNYSESNEARDYLLLSPETRSAIILYSGTPLTNSGVILRDIPAGACQEVYVTIDQPEANVKVFKDIQFELTDLCQQYEAPSAAVSIDIEFVEKVTSTSLLPEELRTAKLGQNSPNPATETTQIPYHIPAAGRQAKLEIMGMDGRVVREFKIDGKGDGQINLPTQSLYQGIYLYRLMIDGIQIDTKKMTIVH